MSETRIYQDTSHLKIGGIALIVLGLPLTLLTGFLFLPRGNTLGIALGVIPCALMVAGGIWIAFSRRRPKLRLQITDDLIAMGDNKGVWREIRLEALESIRIKRPFLSNFDVMTFSTGKEDILFHAFHLDHMPQDIVRLVSVRLENTDKHLREDRSPVLGAGTGVWRVTTGNPFVSQAKRPKKDHV